MSLIVKTITRLTMGLVFLYAIYIVLQAHMGPGSGFAGGVITALLFIQLMLSFGKERVLKKINEIKTILAMSVSAIIFLCIASANFLSVKPRPILLTDILTCIIVAAGLILIFSSLVALTEGIKEK